MMHKKETWFINPSKKTIILFWFLSLLAIGLLMGAMTDFFKEPLQFKKYILFWILIFLNLSTVSRLTYNYYKNTLSH